MGGVARFHLTRRAASSSDLAAQRMVQVNLMYPVPTQEPAVAGIGCRITTTYVISWSPSSGTWEALQVMGRRAEVGGWQQSRKPPRHRKGVSVAIVLGARESRVQGEGRQGWHAQADRRVGTRPKQPSAGPRQTWRHAPGPTGRAGYSATGPSGSREHGGKTDQSQGRHGVPP